MINPETLFLKKVLDTGDWRIQVLRGGLAASVNITLFESKIPKNQFPIGMRKYMEETMRPVHEKYIPYEKIKALLHVSSPRVDGLDIMFIREAILAEEKIIISNGGVSYANAIYTAFGLTEPGRE